MDKPEQALRIIRITDHLWLGNVRAASDAQVLQDRNIKRIFSVLHPPFTDPVVELVASANLGHLILPIRDERRFSEELDAEVRSAMTWLNAGIADHTDTLVHCFAGISRSSSAVATYLIWNGMPFKNVIELLEGQHPLAAPHPLVLMSFLRAIGKKLPPEYLAWISKQWIKLEEDRRIHGE